MGLYSQMMPMMGQLNLNYGAGLKAGYYKSIDSEKGNYFAGFALRLKAISFLAVETEFDYRAPERFSDTLNIQSWPWLMSGLFYLPIKPNAGPYFTVGGGMVYSIYDYTPNPDRTELEMVLRIGLGLEWLFVNRLALDISIHQNFSGFQHRHWWSEDEEENRSGPDAGLGLLFYVR